MQEMRLSQGVDYYFQRIFTFIDEKVGTEYFGSIEDEEEVIEVTEEATEEASAEE